MSERKSNTRPVIKLEWTSWGPGHTRCTIYVGQSGQTLANCGTLTMRPDEATRFRKTVRMGILPPGFEGIAESGWAGEEEDE